MAERDQVIKEKVEHEGVFDFPGLYGFVHRNFQTEGFGVTEEKYAEKVTGNARDIDIEWKISKSFSDYFSVEYKLKFEIRNLTDVEVEVEGARKKMNKGKVSIDLTGALIRDPASKWDTSAQMRFFRDIYNKYVIPTRVEAMRDKVGADIRGAKEKIKGFLDLYGRRT